MKLYINVIVIIKLWTLIQCQYTPPSPCPDVFTYKEYGQKIYGIIRYQPPGQVKYVFMKCTFATISPSPDEVSKGTLDIQGSKESALLKMLRGQALDYWVQFPNAVSLPSVVSVTANGVDICNGPRDVPGVSFSMEHLLLDKGDISSPLAINIGGNGSSTPEFLESNQNFSTTSSVLLLSIGQEEVECGVVSGGNEQVELVYHGTSVARGDWPWLVAIFIHRGGNLQYICAGSLISKEHIITAAHCLKRKGITTRLQEYVLKLGVFNLDEQADPSVSVRGVKFAAIYNNYDSHTLANDILVMTMDYKIVFTRQIRPICLWEGSDVLELIVGRSGSVVGWGANEVQDSGRGEPRTASLPIVSTEKCRASRIEFHKLTSTGRTFCAGHKNGTGPCNGDSGSGLYMMQGGRWRLRGVVSVSLRSITGESKCNLHEYAVFTDVAKFASWIKLQLTDGASDPIASNEEPLESQNVKCGMVSGGNERIPLIHLGADASPGDWPWLVAIFKGLDQKCVGSLVSDKHVLTAGHCYSSSSSTSLPPVTEFVVKLGVTNINTVHTDPNVQNRKVIEVHLHPNFYPIENHGMPRDNIAIFVLERPVEFTTYVRPVCLPYSDPDQTDTVSTGAPYRGVVVGWGANELGAPPQLPKFAHMPVVSHATCLRSNPAYHKLLTKGTFCGGDRNGKGPCGNDSGGGLYVLRNSSWIVRGIVIQTLSYLQSKKCNLYEYVVFTDVVYYLPWIKSLVG